MQLQSVAQVIERLEIVAREHPNGIVAFDGDGTLWSGDVAEDVWDALLESRDVRTPAREALAREAAGAGLAPSEDPAENARRLYDLYQAGKFPEERVCEVMVWIHAGWRRAELRSFIARALEARGLRARLQEEVLEVLDWARRRGLRAVLVSASPRDVVEVAGELAGFTPPQIAAATGLYDGDVLTLGIDRPIPYGPGKVTALEQLREGAALLGAFGDNAFDVAMLQAAAVPVAVRPKDRLRARASEVNLLLELARRRSTG